MVDITTDTCFRCRACDHYGFMVETGKNGARLRCLGRDCPMTYDLTATLSIGRGATTGRRTTSRGDAAVPAAETMTADGKRALTPAELVMWLVGASMVRGRTRLQMETFLLWKEHESVVEDPKFVARGTGPHSQAVSDAVPVLKMRGLLEESLSVYRLTRAGHEHIEQRLQSVGVSTEQIAARKTSWDEWSMVGFAEYISRRYPMYVLA